MLHEARMCRSEMRYDTNGIRRGSRSKRSKWLVRCGWLEDAVGTMTLGCLSHTFFDLNAVALLSFAHSFALVSTFIDKFLFKTLTLLSSG